MRTMTGFSKVSFLAGMSGEIKGMKVGVSGAKCIATLYIRKKNLCKNENCVTFLRPAEISARAMAKDTQINIRFPSNMDRQLTETAVALGVSKSALVRRVTEMFLEEVSETGSVKLHPNWIKGLTEADGRSEWGSSKGKDGSEKPRAAKRTAS